MGQAPPGEERTVSTVEHAHNRDAIRAYHPRAGL
jgi:hypothetical protein